MGNDRRLRLNDVRVLQVGATAQLTGDDMRVLNQDQAVSSLAVIGDASLQPDGDLVFADVRQGGRQRPIGRASARCCERRRRARSRAGGTSPSTTTRCQRPRRSGTGPPPRSPGQGVERHGPAGVSVQVRLARSSRQPAASLVVRDTSIGPAIPGRRRRNRLRRISQARPRGLAAAAARCEVSAEGDDLLGRGSCVARRRQHSPQRVHQRQVRDPIAGAGEQYLCQVTDSDLVHPAGPRGGVRRRPWGAPGSTSRDSPATVPAGGPCRRARGGSAARTSRAMSASSAAWASTRTPLPDGHAGQRTPRRASTIRKLSRGVA
jgi:hypothetical protein